MNQKTLIAEIYDTDFNPNANIGVQESFAVRRACRGVLLQGEKAVLLDVTKLGFHKLPGGGVKEGETLEQAFKRELLEEVGANCEIIDQSGIVVEWRSEFKLLQISYVFLAKVVGELVSNKLEQDEKDNGFQIKWVNANEVSKILENDTPKDYEGNFIKLRDISIVNYYKGRDLI